ncbi:hypothetical protein D3C87_2112940 [compost metagenome]
MLIDCRLDNRQAQAGAARSAIAGFVGAIERPENLLAIFLADARAVVVDHNGDALIVGAECHGNARV